MKKFIIHTMTAAALTSVISLNAADAESISVTSTKVQNMEVLGNYVNVRRGASVSYEVVDQLFIGEKVIAIDQFVNKENELWYRVDLGKIKGWVQGTWLKAINTNNVYPSMKTTVNEVPVRRGALDTYKAVKYLSKNESVTIIDEFTNNLNEKWYRIDLNGVKGWVKSSYLSETNQNQNKIQTISDNVPVHRGALDSYLVVKVLPKNYVVNIIDEFTNQHGEHWVRVDLGDLKGWVKSVLLNNNTSPKPNDPPVTNPIDDSIINAVGKNVTPVGKTATIRRGALSSYRSVYQLNENETGKVLQYFLNQDNEIWYNIELSNLRGWVLASEVQVITNNQPKPEIKYFYVKGSQVPVRRGANISYKEVATLTSNSKIKIIDQFTNQENELWYRVELNPELKGWVNSLYLSEKPLQRKTIYIKNDLTTVLSEHNNQAAVLTKIMKNTDFQTISEYIDETTNQKWYEIEYSTNKFGWINADNISTEPIFEKMIKIVGTQTATLRQSPDLNSTLIDTIPYSTKVTVINAQNNEKNETWYKVTLSNGNSGWVPSWELYTNLEDRKLLYAKTDMNILRGADASYRPIGSVVEDEQLLYLWSHGLWSRVEKSNGVRGWILSSQLSNIAPKQLTGPDIYEGIAGNYVTWNKDKNFPIKYSIESGNTIKITGFNVIESPTRPIVGIESYKKVGDAYYITFKPNYTFTIKNNPNNLQLKIMEKGIKGKTIIVDAGHGAHDPGAVSSSGTKEKDINLAVAKYLKQELESKGATVILTRDNDSFLELSERVAIAANTNADIFISIHINAFTNKSANGTGSYYDSDYNFNGTKSKTLATLLQNSLYKELNSYNRGVYEQDFYVNRNNPLPSVLVELGFITNTDEEKKLKTASYQQSAAIGIRKGIEAYFNQF